MQPLIDAAIAAGATRFVFLAMQGTKPDSPYPIAEVYKYLVGTLVLLVLFSSMTRG